MKGYFFTPTAEDEANLLQQVKEHLERYVIYYPNGWDLQREVLVLSSKHWVTSARRRLVFSVAEFVVAELRKRVEWAVDFCDRYLVLSGRLREEAHNQFYIRRRKPRDPWVRQVARYFFRLSQRQEDILLKVPSGQKHLFPEYF